MSELMKEHTSVFFFHRTDDRLMCKVQTFDLQMCVQ